MHKRDFFRAKKWVHTRKNPKSKLSLKEPRPQKGGLSQRAPGQASLLPSVADSPFPFSTQKSPLISLCQPAISAPFSSPFPRWYPFHLSARPLSFGQNQRNKVSPRAPVNTSPHSPFLPWACTIHSSSNHLFSVETRRTRMRGRTNRKTKGRT